MSLLGLSPQSTPLSAIFPNALQNCDLLVSTEAIQLHLGGQGSATYALALPNDPVFAGLVLFHQFLQV